MTFLPTKSEAGLPLVSVLITSYNHGAFIEQAILSVVNQSYKNTQLIVIDDGSTDDSLSKINSLSKRHNFKVVSQSNAGLPVVINQGISLAKGKYFVSFGSDDVMCLDRIEKQVSFLEENPSYGVCAGNTLIIDESGKQAPKRRLSKKRDLCFENLFLHDKPGIKAPTAMVRKEIFDVVGGYDTEIKLEDHYMWLKITAAGYKVHVMEDVLAYYRKHKENNSKNVVFMADNIEKTYAQYKNHPSYDATLNRLLINLFLKAAKRGYKGAPEILKRVSFKYYNIKVFVGLFYLLFKGR